MCGIAGIVRTQAHAVSLDELKVMTDSIAHRGPDGEGFWLDQKEQVGLGHRRLSILDLSLAGKQPMISGNDRFALTFNGEIYNYIELRDELTSQGVQFKTQTDTEVLLALYEKHGKDMLSKLNGMFAIAIWDTKEQTLFCARDRFGEKPFYYHHNSKEFIFGSEMKVLWASGVEKTVSADTRLNYVTSRKLPTGPRTYFDGIFELPAAHSLTLSKGELSIERYWDIEITDANHSLTFEQATEKFKLLLQDSINIRLRSDVAVGSSLSGGLDSSSIVCLINSMKSADHTQKTFSARFKDHPKDEGRFMETVIKHCNALQPYYTWPNEDTLLSQLDLVCHHQEQPFNSSSIVAQWEVMKLAKENDVTVLLDGQGADEYLAGYLRTYTFYLQQLFNSKDSSYNSELEAYNALHGAVSPIENIRSSESLRMKLGRWKKHLSAGNTPSDLLKLELKRQIQSTSLPLLLRYADRNSMAHSREMRLPFLDHRLIEFVFSLPDEFLLNDGWTKRILRNSMKNVVPRDIVWRVDKTGYETPEEAWMSHPEISERIAKQMVFLDLKNTSNKLVNKGLNWRILMSEYF